MPRIACLHIPQFQIAVQKKYEQANEFLYLKIQRQLVSNLISCSPKVIVKEMGVFLLDASGLSLRGGENQFCHHVLKTCSKAGFTDAYVGIADSAFAAMVASRLNKRRFTIVSPNEDAQFLAPLSIKHLRLDKETENILFALGIKTMGKLASLPISSLNKRFGKAGKIIWQPWELTQGIDKLQPTLAIPEKTFTCSLDLGGAVSNFNEIIFALKSMLDRLTNDLKDNNLCAKEFILSLYNDCEKFDERVLQLTRPTQEAKFLLELIRLSISARPLVRELTNIEITITNWSKEEWEQPNIPNSRSGANVPRFDIPNHKKIAVTENKTKKLTAEELLLVQRFNARLGGNKIFKAQASDKYTSEDAGVWIPVTNTSTNESILPLDLKFIQNKINQQPIPDLVLRPIKASKGILVQLKGSKPAAISYKRRWYKITSIAEPEYLSCQWWDKATAKDYYKILVESNKQTLFMLLTHDKLKNNWSIEGIYD